MKKIGLIVVIVVFSMGLIYAQEEAQEEQNGKAKIDWGIFVTALHQRVNTVYALHKHMYGGGIGGYLDLPNLSSFVFLKGELIPSYKYDSTYGEAKMSQNRFTLGVNYSPVEGIYAGINYMWHKSKTVFPDWFGEEYTAKASRNGPGIQMGIVLFKNCAFDAQFNWVKIKQLHMEDEILDGRITTLAIHYFIF